MTAWLVDLVIAVLAVETMLLALWRRPLLRELAPQLAAGLALVLALRSALGPAGGGSAAVAAWLAIAGIAHGAGVWRGLQSRTTP